MVQSDSSSVDPTYCEIIVVRHGETAWNVDGKIQGQLDVELNEVGREQAVTVANRLSKEFGISVVYSSDLKRALETAKTIANACGGLKVIEDPDLRERHLGDLQGLVFREAAERNPKAYEAFSSKKTDQDIPKVYRKPEKGPGLAGIFTQHYQLHRRRTVIHPEKTRSRLGSKFGQRMCYIVCLSAGERNSNGKHV